MPRPRPLTIALRLWFVPVIVALLAIRACVATPPRSNLAADGSGSIYIARGGPVVIGFRSPGPAHLVIAGNDVTGQGVSTKWLLLPEGPAAVKLTAPPDARLVWSPVGRRGDPEYVPASSLSPEPPASASFSHPGAAIGDGVIALLLLITIIIAVCIAARARLANVSRPMWIAMAAVFATAVLVRWIGLSDHGQTWDEDVNWASGRNYITNLLSLDFRADSWTANFEHPPVMKYLEGIGAQLADGFGPARALSALWIAFGCALLVPIGARIYSLRIGVIAAVFAALLPPLIAHGQIVGHESPTVMWWALGILLSLHIDDEPAQLRRRLVTIGIVIGLATASRFVNGLLGPLCLALIYFRTKSLRATLEGAIGMPVIAMVTLYAVWPRLWAHPFAMLSASFAKLSNVHSPEPFLGIITNTPGPQYFVIYLVATLPIALLVLVVAWLARAFVRRESATWVMVAWLVIPLGVMLSPVRQDGVRYVMPCVLALALCAAAGLDSIARFWKPAAAAVVLYLAITVVRVHPYYLDYFGEQVGGAGMVASHRWFETAWWGEGVDRAVTYVNENAPTDAHVYRDCIEPKHLAWFRENLWAQMAKSIGDATWLVTYAPQTHRCPIPPGFKRVWSVDANGATLAEVWTR